MDNISKGQRITSPEGTGEVLTIFEDKVVVKLDSGQTTTLAVYQVSIENTDNVTQTDLNQESPEATTARAEHASEIVARLDHLTNENANQNNEQTPMNSW